MNVLVLTSGGDCLAITACESWCSATLAASSSAGVRALLGSLRLITLECFHREDTISMFQEFYDAGAEGYGVIFGRVPEHFRTTLLRQARVSTGQSVLDIATGTGIAAEAAARIVGPAGSVIGVDLSRGMLAVAERRLSPFHYVNVQVMDAQALGLPDASFDAVTCSLAIMLMPDPEQALREMYRVLRPKGYASTSVLTTPARSLTGNIQDVIGRYCPDRSAAAAKYSRWAI